MKRDILWLAIAMLVLFSIGFAVFTARNTFRRPLVEREAVPQAKELISKAGGIEAVCREAAQIFAKYPYVSNQAITWWQLGISNWPAIESLGNVFGLYADDLRYIQIRVGDHLNGYTIKIYDTNLFSEQVRRMGSNNIIDGCIEAFK